MYQRNPPLTLFAFSYWSLSRGSIHGDLNKYGSFTNKKMIGSKLFVKFGSRLSLYLYTHTNVCVNFSINNKKRFRQFFFLVLSLLSTITVYKLELRIKRNNREKTKNSLLNLSLRFNVWIDNFFCCLLLPLARRKQITDIVLFDLIRTSPSKMTTLHFNQWDEKTKQKRYIQNSPVRCLWNSFTAKVKSVFSFNRKSFDSICYYNCIGW